ncbi:Imidazole glycerol phosphate synthase subunit HisH [Tenacibaculum litopenaei]|uniref:imidazole glycerol phosphate synthase subunit HisH n=1 Tax=Tenacibaculum litopenaei TaxID=396016 RepID=UPI0038944B49
MIAIVKYNAGNIRSVKNAVTALGYDCIITDNPEELKAADKVIFPGVGEASSAMNYLQKRGLDTVLTSLTQPVLGICLGLQLLCDYSEEGEVACLGVFKTKTKRFPEGKKIPHMGWNNFTSLAAQPILESMNAVDDVYYVHSYYAEPCESTIAICDYGIPFSSVMQRDNFYAMQFHPEKSAQVGRVLLQNFLEL